MARVVTREEYFEAALTILGADGPGGLKIGPLTKRLGVTSGSFYHYFGALDGFVDALLEHWEREQTLRIIELASSPADPRERVRRLKELALTLPHEAEAAIRAWARSNASVAVAQKRVDAEREEALQVVVGGVVSDKKRAALLATIGMTFLVGIQQWRQPVDAAELGRILDEFEAMVLS